jgi:hypothetical protein
VGLHTSTGGTRTGYAPDHAYLAPALLVFGAWKARQQMQLDSDANGLVHLTLEPGEHIFVHGGSAEALLMGGSSSWRAFQQPWHCCFFWRPNNAATYHDISVSRVLRRVKLTTTPGLGCNTIQFHLTHRTCGPDGPTHFRACPL